MRLLVSSFVLATCVLAACGGAAPAPSPPAPPLAPNSPDQSTVKLYVIGNRPYVDITLRKPDGSSRIGRFLVDSGGGAFILAQPLALGLGLTSQQIESNDGKFAKVDGPLEAKIGQVALVLDPERTLVAVDQDSLTPKGAPGRSDGMLPGHVLAQFHVVFDYPAGRFTIAKPGVLTPRGAASEMPVRTETGFPRTELVIDGKPHGFLLDTGAAFTMMSEVLLQSLSSEHSTWPRYHGAYGDAKLLGGQTLETLFLGEAAWAGHALSEVGVTSQKTGTFEQMMSGLMTAPIEGSLAGNVLKAFRVELDYPNQKLYLSKP